MGKVERAQEAASLARMQAAAVSILTTTGDVQAKYQPVNIVFAIGGSTGGLFTTASPQKAFEGARYQLQLAALALGGNAVVFCSFQYVAHAAGARTLRWLASSSCISESAPIGDHMIWLPFLELPPMPIPRHSQASTARARQDIVACAPRNARWNCSQRSDHVT